MKLLIVDDEIYAIQGILDSINWKELPFKEILTANSYSQALNIFQTTTIDILVSDIEMPYGSGLELVEWVKGHSPSTECIFLTCHDEFDFATQAIKLKCFDYLLKPILPEKLIHVLEQAIYGLEARNREEQYKEYGKQYLKKLSESSSENTQQKSKDIIKEVECYIQQHISDGITVEELSRVVYLSPDHLTRLFKKKKGQTLIDYITSQRMFLAKELLMSNELTISKISSKVGYGNYSYFTKVFKKYYGMTPTEYQNHYLKKHRG